MSTSTIYKKNNLLSAHSTKTEMIKDYSALNVGGGYEKPIMAVYSGKSTGVPNTIAPEVSEYVGIKAYKLTSPMRPNDVKLYTPNRKYSDNCDSNDETKSISSIYTTDSIYSKTPGKKSGNDFKVKYKTEMCKYWDMYKSCKFGDNV
jgi:hypothetical protein